MNEKLPAFSIIARSPREAFSFLDFWFLGFSVRLSVILGWASLASPDRLHAHVQYQVRDAAVVGASLPVPHLVLLLPEEGH